MDTKWKRFVSLFFLKFQGPESWLCVRMLSRADCTVMCARVTWTRLTGQPEELGVLYESPRVTLTVFITPFQLRPQLAFPQLDIERKCLNSEVNRKRATGDKAVPVAGRPNTSAYQQESLHCNRDFTLSLAFLSNKREGCKFAIISDSFTCTKIAPIWCSIKRNNLFYFSENGYYFWATESHFGILNEWPIIGALFWCLSKTPHEWFSLMLIPLRVKWTAVLNLSVPLRKKKMDKLFNIRCHFTDDQIE